MPRAYAEDLRSRVIAAVEAGRAAREVARVFQVSPSAAIKWVQRWRRSGSAAAKPMGGERRSPLDRHADYLLALGAAEPDLTLAEIRGRLRARRCGRGSLRSGGSSTVTASVSKKTVRAAEQDRA